MHFNNGGLSPDVQTEAVLRTDSGQTYCFRFRHDYASMVRALEVLDEYVANEDLSFSRHDAIFMRMFIRRRAEVLLSRAEAKRICHLSAKR